jgi:uncharacterized membrane protein
MKPQRQRTNDANEYIRRTMQEIREAHKRTMQTGQAAQAEILAEQRRAFIGACIGYKGGFVVWLCVCFTAWLFIT